MHFSHRNIIRYCDRPFDDVEEMNDWIATRWLEQVAPEDEVWVLGDAVMGKLDVSLPVFSRLSGRITLVVGNHDRPFRAAGAPDEVWDERYLAAGVGRLIHGSHTVTVAGVEVCVCHFPYRGDSHDEDRFVDHRPTDIGLPLLHGHVHQSWRRNGRMINVGVDAWAGNLVSDTDIATLLRQDLAQGQLVAPLPWRK